MCFDRCRAQLAQHTGEVVREEAMTPSECQMHMFDSSVIFEEFMRNQRIDEAPPAEASVDDPPKAN